MAQHYGPHIVTDGLVLNLDAADKTSYPGSGTTWTDLSGYGYNGSLVNSPTYITQSGSLDFDGTDQYSGHDVDLGDDLGNNYDGSLSVSIWFKADVTNGEDGLFSIDGFRGSVGEFDIILKSDTIQWTLNAAGWNRTVAFTDKISWHHLVCIYDTSGEAGSKMYLDGVAVGATGGSFPADSDMDFESLVTTIGAWKSSSFSFNGQISIVIVYARALTASEVLQNFNVHRHKYEV
jgi:hypothetical protein